MRYLALAFLLITGITFADPFSDARDIFVRASSGQEKEVEHAIGAFQALLKGQPGNPVYMAYLGSAQAQRARDALLPWNRMKYTEEGLDTLDRALASIRPEHDKALLRGVPMAIETRLVAANTFLRIPDGIFHRRAQGRKLVAEMQKHPAYAGSPEPFRKAVEAAAAEAAK
jgi:hypothetical protein